MTTPTNSEMLREAINGFEKSADAFSNKSKTLENRTNTIEANLRELEQHVANQPVGGLSTGTASGPSIASTFAKSDSLAAMVRGANSTGRVEIPVALNAITSTGQGGTEHDVQPNRAAGIFNDPRRALSLLSLLPTLPVTTGRFEYMRLDGYVNSAAVQVKEGDKKAEGDMPAIVVDTPISTLAHFVRASAQIIDDAPALERQINSLLQYGLMAKLESSLIVGDGTLGSIDGLLNQATSFSAPAFGTPDQIGQAIAELDSNGWRASAVVLNPIDWFTIASERATDNQYVLGTPSNPAPRSLWGVPVALSPSLALGTALVMDTSQTAILDRQQPTIMASRVDGENMTTNMVTILAEMRAGLAVFSTGAVLNVDLTAAT